MLAYCTKIYCTIFPVYNILLVKKSKKNKKVSFRRLQFIKKIYGTCDQQNLAINVYLSVCLERKFFIKENFFLSKEFHTSRNFSSPLY